MKIKRIGRACILTPVNEPLSKVSHHHDFAGIKRLLLIGKRLCPCAPLHMAIHQIDFTSEKGNDSKWRYTQPHKHNFDEINVVWSENGKLEYRFEIDGRMRKVKSPAAVVIPAGVVHRAEAVRGNGSFICILLNSGVEKT